MPASTTSQETTNWTRILVIGVVTVAVLSGVGFGLNYLWESHYRPTQASAADCKLAQQIVDETQTPPSDKAQVQAWMEELHKARRGVMVDQGLSTEIGYYVRWAAVKAAGEGGKLT